jgi:inosose dehydratase
MNNSSTRMHRSVSLANAPCSWGVDFADRPENPAWEIVMDEVAAAGFRAVDLGPVGYFPTDPSRLRDELSIRGLHLSAGGLFDPLCEPRAISAILDKTRRTCRLLRSLDAPRLVIIDQVSSERGSTAGQSRVARRLDSKDWAQMMKTITQIARIARDEYGVSSYLHAHAGCYIEFEDELDRAMNDLPSELVGLCVDTGHSAYSGMDPISLIHRYAARVGHMHFKDIDPTVHADCLQEGLGFFDSIKRKVFCPLGNRAVDFAAVSNALKTIGYSGLVVVEQDIDSTGVASPLDNARASLTFLRSVGLGQE